MDVKQFLMDLPNKVNADAIAGHNTVFHFDMGEGSQYTVRIVEGKMDASEGLQGDSTCKVTTSADTLGKVLSGDTNPMMAMMTGKLKISNVGEMMKYAKIFGIM